MASLNDVLATAPLFSYLDSAARAALVAALQPESIKAREVLFNQGGDGDRIWVVVEGGFALQREDADGQRTTVGRVRAGDVVGGAVWLDPARRRNTAVAASDGLLYALDHEMVAGFRETQPELVSGLVRGLSAQMAARLRDAQTRLRKATGEGLEPLAARPSAALEAVAWPRPVAWAQQPLLATFERSALEPLLAAAPPTLVRDGAWLCRTGERGDTAFLVVGGAVAVVDTRAKPERVLSILGTGSFPCQMSLLTSLPYAASIRAHGDAGLLPLSRPAFRRLLDAHDPLAAHLLEQVTVACVRQFRLSSGVTGQLRARQRAEKRRLEGGAVAEARRSASAPVESTLRLWAEKPPPATVVAEPLVGDAEEVASGGFVKRALGRVGMSLEDLDNVEVAKIEGVISAAELKARKGG